MTKSLFVTRTRLYTPYGYPATPGNARLIQIQIHPVGIDVTTGD